MSQNADRLEISGAISGMAGITCSPYFVQTTKAGDAMVRFDRYLVSENGFGGMNTWQVIVILPQDLAAAEKWLDTNLEGLLSVAETAMIVGSAIPQQLQVDQGTIPCVVIEGTRAA